MLKGSLLYSQWSNLAEFWTHSKIMNVLIACKFKKYLLNINRKTVTKKQQQFFRHSRAANSVVGGQIKLKFELISALMHVPIIWKYQKD